MALTLLYKISSVLQALKLVNKTQIENSSYHGCFFGFKMYLKLFILDYFYLDFIIGLFFN